MCFTDGLSINFSILLNQLLIFHRVPCTCRYRHGYLCGCAATEPVFLLHPQSFADGLNDTAIVSSLTAKIKAKEPIPDAHFSVSLSISPKPTPKRKSVASHQTKPRPLYSIATPTLPHSSPSQSYSPAGPSAAG